MQCQWAHFFGSNNYFIAAEEDAVVVAICNDYSFISCS